MEKRIENKISDVNKDTNKNIKQESLKEHSELQNEEQKNRERYIEDSTKIKFNQEKERILERNIDRVDMAEKRRNQRHSRRSR